MSVVARPIPDAPHPNATVFAPPRRARSQSIWAMALRSTRVIIGGGVLLVIVLACLLTLPWTIRGNPAPYEEQVSTSVRQEPRLTKDEKIHPPSWLGYDALGRSLLARCLLGGTISLGVGVAAAAISVVVG